MCERGSLIYDANMPKTLEIMFDKKPLSII